MMPDAEMEPPYDGAKKMLLLRYRTPHKTTACLKDEAAALLNGFRCFLQYHL